MAMDIVGPLPTTPRGHKYLLTAMCLHTKYPEAITLKRVDTEAVVEALMESFLDNWKSFEHWPPNLIIKKKIFGKAEKIFYAWMVEHDKSNAIPYFVA